MFYVYRLFNAANELLWVGQTTQLTARFAKHRQERPWAGEIATATVTPVVDLEAALTAETEAIKIENPKYNKIEGETRIAGFTLDMEFVRGVVVLSLVRQFGRVTHALKNIGKKNALKKGLRPVSRPRSFAHDVGDRKDPGPAYCKDCKKIVNREAYRRKIAGKTA